MGGILGSSKPQPQTTTQTTEPPAYLRPFLEQAASEARNLYQNPTEQFYPNQTYVSPSSQTLDSLALMENRARSGSGLNAAAQAELQKTIAGDYASPEYFTQQFNPVVDAFNNNVLPGIQSQFAKAGRYGSNASSSAVADAGRGLTRELGAITSNAMQQERARQLMAAQLAPQMAQNDYYDIGQLAAVGESREGIEAQKLQEDMSRFNFQQNKDAERLNQYISQLANNPYSRFGTSTQVAQPSYIKPNRFMQGLGLATTIGGLAFGNPFASMAGVPMAGGGIPAGATMINTAGGLPWAR